MCARAAKRAGGEAREVGAHHQQRGARGGEGVAPEAPLEGRVGHAITDARPLRRNEIDDVSVEARGVSAHDAPGVGLEVAQERRHPRVEIAELAPGVALGHEDEVHGDGGVALPEVGAHGAPAEGGVGLAGGQWG
jgi:hypothetical protein